MKAMAFWAAGAAAFLAAGCCCRCGTVAEFRGEIGAASGWNFVASEAGKVVYIPFEGYYESKGGRIESPLFSLDKPAGENAYYELRFSAKSAVDGFWWVDLYDSAGEMLPDVNSRLYASADWKDYAVMVPAGPAAAKAKIAFISKKGALVRDVSMRRVSASAAAQWCARMYAQLPQIDFAAPAGAWDKAPKARAALVEGKRLDVVLLGDSIMNDSYCGLFTALVQNEFPKADLRFTLSVRGSTGCWYYHEADKFADYVAKYRPQLVLIGGISNYRGKQTHTVEQTREMMVETIRRCQELGAEVIVCSPPPSYEFRSSPEPKPFNAAEFEGVEQYKYLFAEYERQAAARTGVQFWDLTSAPCDAISRSGKPLDWFKRDAAHNDDRGKQLIAQTILQYFRAARQ